MNGFQNNEISKVIMDIENKKKTIAQASNNEQNVIRQKIHEIYGKVGEATYDLYADDSFEIEKITDTLESLRSLHKTLKEKQAKLDEILSRYDEELKILRPALPTGQEICPSCRTAYIPGEMLFCSKCGGKLLEKAPATDANAATGQSVCPNCKATLVPGSVFCSSCGQKVSSGTQAAGLTAVAGGVAAVASVLSGDEDSSQAPDLSLRDVRNVVGGIASVASIFGVDLGVSDDGDYDDDGDFDDDYEDDDK